MKTELEKKHRIPSFLRHVGPGIITGAADDDPSGIATYTQAGAQFGSGVLWTVFLSLPFMIAIQLVSARIGRQSGKGIAANLREHSSTRLLVFVVSLLVVANTINIAADISAMGEALQLIVGGGEHFHSVIFGVITVLLQVFIPYRKLAPILKWLTLSLLVYVALAFTVNIPWASVAHDLAFPRIENGSAFAMTVVAVLGTTISPYLFFWQASQEVEEMRLHGIRPGREQIYSARKDMRRLRFDTIIGMTFSNVIAFFIMLAGAFVLHASGMLDIKTAKDAATALRPLAGDTAFILFSIGIITTGMLAVPVLASSSAYAVAECFGWRDGLQRRWNEAKGFYAIISLATIVGTLLDFTPIDPMKALYFSAVINGAVAVPIMAAMMILSSKVEVMGSLVVKRKTLVFGWGAVSLMLMAVFIMLVDMIK